MHVSVIDNKQIAMHSKLYHIYMNNYISYYNYITITFKML